MTNKWNKVIYTGVTNNLIRRVYEHRTGLLQGFTKIYSIDRLVYFEATGDVIAAITREKEIKKWRREKKDALVNATNPEWVDLNEGF